MSPAATTIHLGTLNPVTILAAAGIAAGLWLLLRGLRDHVTGTRIADTATSTISAIALGEVRVSGTIEPAELLLVSPLQSRTCVFYRSRVDVEDREWGHDFAEERAVGFRVRDPSGTLRVFPRGARFDVPEQLHDSSGTFGEPPPGLRPRSGPAFGPANPSHAELVDQLLTVHPPSTGPLDGDIAILGGGAGTRKRTYREARLEPGMTVTILGRVLPFGQLTDPAEADLDEVVGGPMVGSNDPEVAGDIAEARAAGLLADSPDEAWGNAAIPGFGIGRPTRAPELDPAARPLAIAPPDERERFARTFDLAPDSLVLAASDEIPLVIAAGAPGEAVARREDRFVVGLLGGMLAIAAALVLAASLSGFFGP